MGQILPWQSLPNCFQRHAFASGATLLQESRECWSCSSWQEVVKAPRCCRRRAPARRAARRTGHWGASAQEAGPVSRQERRPEWQAKVRCRAPVVCCPAGWVGAWEPGSAAGNLGPREAVAAGAHSLRVEPEPGAAVGAAPCRAGQCREIQCVHCAYRPSRRSGKGCCYQKDSS